MTFCKIYNVDEKQFLFWIEDYGNFMWCLHQVFYLQPDKQIDMKIESDNGPQLFEALKRINEEHCKQLKQYVESIYGPGNDNVH